MDFRFPTSLPSKRLVQGLLLSAGAPLGWLLIRMLSGISPLSEIISHAGLYTYMLVATMAVFGSFAYYVGKREEILESIGLTDGMTGLRNIRYFRRRLQEAITQGKRTGYPLAIVVLDLDHFKKVNDTYGHPVGDHVLKSASQAIQSIVRGDDTAARVGGEEFALILPGQTGPQGVLVAERVREAIHAAGVRLPAKDDPIRVTASAGVASTAEWDRADVSLLYERADKALLRAKADGRNRVILAPSLEDAS